MKKKVAIIGGKLQGLEAVLLCSQCGYESILIDNNPDAPAGPLADRFVNFDVIKGDKEAIAAMEEADFVLPTNENTELLEAICRICDERGLKLAFDRDAYAISSSKKASDRLFAENGIPAPRYYPEGEAPYIIKPSEASGSKGVKYAETREEVERFLADCDDKEQWVIQEYLTGPSYSIEVIGCPGNYRTYEVTKIHMDDAYDCCRVSAPVEITEAEEKELSDIGVRIAEILELKGIMDVEVIHHKGRMKVLEIDARLPSQTPLCVLASSGVNYMEEIAAIVEKSDFDTPEKHTCLPASYEHYMRREGRLFQGGEGYMTEAGRLYKGDKLEFVWDYNGTAGQDFSAIFILTGMTDAQLEARRSVLREKLNMLP